MNKLLKSLFMLALLFAVRSQSFALFTSVNLSTGTAGVGNVDPIWQVKVGSGSFGQSFGLYTVNWNAVGAPCNAWTAPNPFFLATTTLTYRTTINLASAPYGPSQIAISTIVADNNVSGITVNGVFFSFGTIAYPIIGSNIIINLPIGLITSGTNTISVDVSNLAGMNGQSTPAGLLMCAKLNYDIPNIISNPSTCSNRLSVIFSTDQGISSGMVCNWNFGDGTVGTGLNPAHTYSQAGTYTVVLTITNGSNITYTTITQNIVIGGPPVITGTIMSLCDPSSMIGAYTISGPSGSTYNWTITGTFGTYSSNVSYTDITSSGSNIRVDWTNILAQLESQRPNHPHDIPVVQLCVKNNLCGTTTCITLSGCCKAIAPSDGPSNYVSFNVKDAILVPVGTGGSTPLPTSNAGGFDLTGYIGVPANVSNIYFNVTGYMGIATDVTFSNTHFTGNENAVIPVFPGKNVGLTKSVLEGCYYMWRGVENNGKLTIEGTQLLDAKVGVNNQNQAGMLAVSNSLFNNNETDIWANNSPTTSANFNITNSIFTSRDIYNGSQNASVVNALVAGTLGSSLGSSIGTFTSGNIKGSPFMGIAVNQVRSSYGIQVQTPGTSTTTIGLAGAANRNYFDNKEKAGIITSSSNVNILNNTFGNMLSATADNGAGIVINNIAGTIPTLNIGVAGANTFTNMNNGVLATGECKFNVLSNAFSFITRKGVRMQKWYASSSSVGISLAKVKSNTFSQCMYDVYAYNNTTINAEIADNTSTFTAGNKDYSVNVYIDEINRPYTAYYILSNNRFTGKEFGLYSQNTRNMNVIGNIITIAAPNQVAPSNAAIWLNNSDAGNYTGNVLTSLANVNAQNQDMAGVRASTSGINTFKCNAISKVGYCMSFSGPCSSNLHKNTFNSGNNTAIIGIFLDKSYTGPLVFNSAGTLYCAENTFGLFSVAHTYAENNSVGSDIYYPGAANSSNTMYPGTNIAVSPSFVYTPVPNSNEGAVSCGSSNPPYMILPSVSPFMGASYELDFGDYTPKMYATARKSIYEYVMGESLTNDDLNGTDDFKDMMSTTPTAIFYQVDTKILEYLDSRDLSVLYEAIDKNEAAATGNNMDENQKLFNAVYMSNLQSDTLVSDSVLDILRTLAKKCPLTDGTSIYQARAMLRQYDDDVYMNECEVTSGPEGDPSITDPEDFTTGVKEVKGTKVVVYPNPAGAEVKFSNLPEGTSITLYNILGMEVMSKKATEAEVSIDTHGLQRGMYIYKVMKGAEVIKTEKLLLIQ